ncbi:MAG: transposase [Planctomycetaceae bacterium]
MANHRVDPRGTAGINPTGPRGSTPRLALFDTDKQAHRPVKRPNRECEDLFAFLDPPGLAFGNNAAERRERPAVITRRHSCGSRSQRGADGQGVPVSLFRTSGQRNHDPASTICSAFTTRLTAPQL